MSDIEIEANSEEFRAAGPSQQKKLRAYRDRLAADPFLGDRIPRDRVPRKFRDLPNLFRLELPEAWRALYTVATSPGRRTVVRVVWIGDHIRYNRLFGYSG